MYTVYALYNADNQKIYIGQTEDLERRLELHNNHQLGGYTSRFDGIWVIIYSEEVATRTEALVREKQLKSYQGRQFIKKRIPQ